MLQPLRTLFGYHLAAEDGQIGTIDDLLFDDQQWVVRYVVVDTGTWLTERQVLVAPQAMGEANHDDHLVPVRLSCAQIEQSPGIENHLPVSRQYQDDLAEYYGWTPYWVAMPFPVGVPPSIGGPAATAAVTAADEPHETVEGEATIDRADKPPRETTQQADEHLRSAREVIGYHIHATDGRIGHVEDFIIDTDSWCIAHLLVDTRNWLPGGRKVIVQPRRIDRLDEAEQDVYVQATRSEIESGKQFNAAHE